MNPSSNQREMHRLIESLIDQRCDDATRAAINRRLEEDRAFRQQYIDCMSMEAELHAMHAAPTQADAAQPEPVCTLEPLRDEARYAGRWRSVMIVAASLALVAIGSSLLTYLATSQTGSSVAQGSGDANIPLAGNPKVVAHITGTRDCRWSSPGVDTGFGASLLAGQELDLDQGLAEITFENGSRLVLEGPSRFLVPDADRAKLIAGRLSAAVPETAVGFCIETNRVAVSTAGTQFGLVANGDGTNELHVFDGPLQARVLDRQGLEVERLQLNMTEAARFVPVSTRVDRFNADSNSFVRSIDPIAGPSDGLLVLEEFDYPPGPIALHNGGFGWAGAWEELNRASEPDESSTNLVAEGSLLGSTLISRGNRLHQTGQFNRIRRVLSTSLNSVFAVEGLIEDQNGTQLIGREGRSVYVSFLQRASDTDDLFYGLELHRADGNLNRVLCIGSGAEFTGYGVSSNYNGVETPQSDRTVCIPLFEPLGEEDTNTHLFVVRIDYGPFQQDVATVYRDPASLLNEQACTPTATLRGDFAFDRVSIANFDGIKGKIHEVDEIRIGTSYTAVTGQRATSGQRMAMTDGPAMSLPISAIHPTFGLSGSQSMAGTDNTAWTLSIHPITFLARTW